MATRTIVTSQPDVACEVCERRLLRGEHADVFIAAGRRRIVCELCATRAAHEGWMRETDTGSLALPPMRPRRGRSLLERLRQVGRSPGDLDEDEDSSGEMAGEPAYEVLEQPVTRAPEPVVRGRLTEPPAPPPFDEQAPEDGASPSGTVAFTEEPAEDSLAAVGDPVGNAPSETYEQLALEVFNASEFPRRLAGVARSLGEPEVSVRSAEHLSSVVWIVVAWELCWYRYEVDLSVAPAQASAVEQGTELSELPRDDRLANCVVDPAGALSLPDA